MDNWTWTFQISWHLLLLSMVALSQLVYEICFYHLVRTQFSTGNFRHACFRCPNYLHYYENEGCTLLFLFHCHTPIYLFVIKHTEWKTQISLFIFENKSNLTLYGCATLTIAYCIFLSSFSTGIALCKLHTAQIVASAKHIYYEIYGGENV